MQIGDRDLRKIPSTNKCESFKGFVLDQLRPVDNIRCRAMFGGYGLYRGTVFFGIISKSRLYFRTNPKCREAYLERGMRPFRPNPKQELQNYYEVPIDVLEDRDVLEQWAAEAVRCAPQKRKKAGRL